MSRLYVVIVSKLLVSTVKMTLHRIFSNEVPKAGATNPGSDGWKPGPATLNRNLRNGNINMHEEKYSL